MRIHSINTYKITFFEELVCCYQSWQQKNISEEDHFFVIKTILEQLKTEPDASKKNQLADGCLRVIRQEGKKEEIDQIQKIYDQIYPAFEMTVVFDKEEKTFQYNWSFKKILEEKSAYFKNACQKENLDLSPSKKNIPIFEKLIHFWTNDEKPATLQDAFDIFCLTKFFKGNDRTLLSMISLILEFLPSTPLSSERNLILEECYKTAKRIGQKEETSKVQEIYDQLNPPFTITVLFKGQKKSFTYPASFKLILEEKSEYFKVFFSGKFKEKQTFELSPYATSIDTFDNLIQCWAKNKKLKSIQEFIDCLSLGKFFMVEKDEPLLSQYESSLVEEISSWNVSDRDTLLKVIDIIYDENQIWTDKIKEAYIQYFKKAFSSLFATYQEPSLVRLSLKAFKKLEPGTLYLNGYEKLSDVSFQRLDVQNFTAVNLSKCTSLTDKSILWLFQKAKSLTSVDLSFCKITEVAIKEISKSKHLESLNLRKCRHIRGKGFAHLVNNWEFYPRKADGRYATNKLSGITKTLTHLDLSETLITSNTIYGIVCKIKNLQKFHLSNCDLLQDFDPEDDDSCEILDSLIKNSPNLESLNLNFFINLKDLEKLKLLQNLKNLELEDCEISDKQLSLIVENNQYLKSVRLSKITFKKETLFELASLENLQKLRLLNCSFKEESFLEFSKNRSLLELDLSLTSIKNQELQSLTKIPTLQKLILKNCTSVTDNGIKALLKNSKSLAYLDLRGCQGVTKKAIDEILKTNPKLKIQY